MPFSQPFEHFGEVSMQVYDLAKAWEKFRAGRERHFLEEVGRHNRTPTLRLKAEQIFWQPIALLHSIA